MRASEEAAALPHQLVVCPRKLERWLTLLLSAVA